MLVRFSVQPHLDVLSQAVEDLLGDSHGLGEVPLSRIIYDLLPGIIPVKIADGFLHTFQNNFNSMLTRCKRFASWFR